MAFSLELNFSSECFLLCSGRMRTIIIALCELNITSYQNQHYFCQNNSYACVLFISFIITAPVNQTIQARIAHFFFFLLFGADTPTGPILYHKVKAQPLHGYVHLPKPKLREMSHLYA